MARFNNNDNDASSSSSSPSSSPNETAIQQPPIINSTTSKTETNERKVVIGQTEVSLIGQACGHHGPYTFYKAFKYSRSPDELERVLMLGEFFFVRISPNDDPCIGELQLVWEDHQHHQLLSSTRLYFLPEQTPEGRLCKHGEHEVLAAKDKVILKLTDLVTWITHKVDWIAGMEYKWKAAPSSDVVSDLSLISSTSSSLKENINANKDDEVKMKENSNDEKQHPTTTTSSPHPPKKSLLTSLAFLHNQNVIPPNGSVPFLTSQRYISDRCKIILNNNNDYSNNNNSNINESSSTLTTSTTTSNDQQRYCRSFTCSRVDFSDIIPLKLKTNELQNDLSTVVVLPYSKYCRFRCFLRRIKGREEEILFGHPLAQDVLTELGIPQQRNNRVNILFCRESFNHEALLNNDLNCDHLAPKWKGRPRKKPLKTVRASSPESISSEENNAQLFSPRRTRRTTAASTLASNRLSQSLLDKRKKNINKNSKTKNLKRSNTNNNNNNNQVDKEDENKDVNNCDNVVAGATSELNKNSKNSNVDHKKNGKENKQPTINTHNNINEDNNNTDSHGDIVNIENSESKNKNKKMNDPVDSNNNIDSDNNRNDNTASDDDGRFSPLICDDDSLKNNSFRTKLFYFMSKRGTPIHRLPNLGLKKIDLYRFFMLAKKYGGYDQLTEKRLWKKVYDDMGGKKKSTSAATCTRRHYENLLLPYERYLNGQPDEISNRKKKRIYRDSINIDSIEDESSNFDETSKESKENVSEGGIKSSDKNEDPMIDINQEILLKKSQKTTVSTPMFNVKKLSETCSPNTTESELVVSVINKQKMDSKPITDPSSKTEKNDIKLIPIGSNECMKKEKGKTKLLRDIIKTETTNNDNENMLIVASNENKNSNKKQETVKRIKLGKDYEKDKCLITMITKDMDHRQSSNINDGTTINQKSLLDNNKNELLNSSSTTVVLSNTNSHQKMTALVHPTQRILYNNNAIGNNNQRDFHSSEKDQEFLLFKSFENKNNFDNKKTRSKVPSHFHSIANLVSNNNDDTNLDQKEAKITKITETLASNCNGISNVEMLGINNPVPSLPIPSALSSTIDMKKNENRKKILSFNIASLSSPMEQFPAYSKSSSNSNNSTVNGYSNSHSKSKINKSFDNIIPTSTNEILDLSVKKHLNQVSSRTSPICKMPLESNRIKSEIINGDDDGVLLDLSIKNYNEINSIQSKLIQSSTELGLKNSFQMNHSIPNKYWNSTEKIPKNYRKKDRNQVIAPSPVPLPSMSNSQIPVADGKRSSKKTYKQNKMKPTMNNIKLNISSTNQTNNSSPQPRQQPPPSTPLISDYNPQLPQFFPPHLWNNLNPFQMQQYNNIRSSNSESSVVSGSSSPFFTTSSLPPPLAFSNNTVSSIPNILPDQQILSPFSNFNPSSLPISNLPLSSSSTSSSLDAAMILDQFKMIQTCQLKKFLESNQFWLNQIF